MEIGKDIIRFTGKEGNIPEQEFTLRDSATSLLVEEERQNLAQTIGIPSGLQRFQARLLVTLALKDPSYFERKK